MNALPENILVNNHHYIAYNKPGGMAVQSVYQKDQSLEVLLYNYCKTPLFLIHRIDQPCSGIVLFAKKKTNAAYFSESMKQQAIRRTYFAVITQKPPLEADSLKHYLFAHKKSNKSFVVDEHHKEGKLAELDYVFKGELSERRFLIEIHLKTGRHHQIRSQLGAIGCPIVGDIKYGSKETRTDGSIALHAASMSFNHPVDNKLIEIKAPCPDNELWAGANVFISN